MTDAANRQTAPEIDAVAAATALPAIEAQCTVKSWLENTGRYSDSFPELIDELARRLNATGFGVDRLSMVLRTLHPQIDTAAYIWTSDSGEVTVRNGDHGTQTRDAYIRSPVRTIFEGAPGVRRRLRDPACPRDYPILDDLVADGITDYLVLPVVFHDGRRYAATFATRRAEGFSDEDLRRLSAIMPDLSLVAEVLAVRQITSNLMDTYLGHRTGERVLQGAIQRGSTEAMEAAIWLSDLRGFTNLSERLEPEIVLDHLNRHFENVVEPIHSHGGEVLKFMGDAVLAIFPTLQFGSPARATGAALEAVKDSLAATGKTNAERMREQLPAIDFGVALHLGRVSYGNIGSRSRLDFTVIGPAVNHVARIGGMCRTLNRTVLASEAFARAAPAALTSLGRHALRGVPGPHELFTYG